MSRTVPAEQLTVPAEQRIAAVILPRLATELILEGEFSLDPKPHRPLGVVVLDGETSELPPTTPLSAVCLRAERAGVQAGQTIAEATAAIAHLRIEALERRQLEARLRTLAEVVNRFGTSIGWEAPDTLWLDVTGVSHLFGGEQALAEEIAEQIRLQGHLARVAVSGGPVLARAFARFSVFRSGKRGVSAVSLPSERTKAELASLPLSALPLDAEKVGWFSALGIFTVEELSQLPKKNVATRLGARAGELLELMEGIDRTPLTAGTFPQVLTESIEWEHASPGITPLLFALRGLLARLSARLSGRGEAASLLEVELFYDRAVARHRGTGPQTLQVFELCTPLYKDFDLLRIIRSRLERLELSAPVVGLQIRASQLSPQVMRQMSLAASQAQTLEQAHSPDKSAWGRGSPRQEELPLLIAELEADVGRDNVGVLALTHAQRPEARSLLTPLSAPSDPQKSGPKPKQKRSSQQKRSFAQKKRLSQQETFDFLPPQMSDISRLFPQPQSVNVKKLQPGARFGLGTELYTIDRLRFLQRLDGVEWWTEKSSSRDYFWAWLKSPQGGTEALLFTDRYSGKSYVHGILD